MKVLHLGKYYWPASGGIENHTRILCEELVYRGVDVEIACIKNGGELSREEINSVKVLRFPLKMPKSFNLVNVPISIAKNFRLIMKDFTNYVKNSDADLIHIHLPNPWATLSAIFSGKKNIIVTYHSDIIGKPFTRVVDFFTKELLKRARAIIVQSPYYVDSSENLRGFKDKIFIVPSAVDLEEFSLDKKTKTRVEEIKSLYENKKIILFLGRLVKYKGVEYLIEAMKRIVFEEDSVLLIAGDGHLRKKLEQRAKFIQSIKFLGHVSNEEIKALYHACDVFVLPSITRAEAFGLVQAEAMACGKPVVSTAIEGSGVPWVNQNNETGLVVPPSNSDSLAEAILKILKNSQLAKKFGSAGRKRAEELFSKEAMAENTLKIYKSFVTS